VIAQAWIEGTSTRKVTQLVKALGNDTGISKSTVSRIRVQIDEGVAVFLDRPLDDTWYPYPWLDATHGNAQIGHRVVSQAVVVATGCSFQGRREILGMAVGEAETTDF
jgi:transposase-like protein